MQKFEIFGLVFAHNSETLIAMKLTSLLFVLMFTVTTFSHAAGLIPVFKNEKATFSMNKEANTSDTRFTLNATSAQIKDLQSKASEISHLCKLTTTSIGSNVYQCDLHITAQYHAEYVSKMFVLMGIEKFEFEGKQHGIMELYDVVMKKILGL
jgi:hypothetical protein